MNILETLFSHSNSIIAVLVVLGGLIFFHELGHFLMARSLGIGVKAFSLGFGPKIITIRRKKTNYCLSLIPLGGYVSLAGEDQESIDTKEHESNDLFSVNEKFSNRPAWHRLLVVIAGPIANIILAFLIYWGVLWIQGNTFVIPEIGSVAVGSPADRSGMIQGDLIISINDNPIHQWEDIARYVSKSNGNSLSITILRNNEPIGLMLTPELSMRKTIFGEEKPAWLLGVMTSGKTSLEKLTITKAAFAGIKKTYSAVSFTLESLVKLFQKVVPLNNLGGPILIAQMVGQQATSGMVPVLLLAALISINLGILNLLPIPILDGGHIVFLLLEMILHKPIHPMIKNISMKIGMFILLSLMLFATWNDLMRIFS